MRDAAERYDSWSEEKQNEMSAACMAVNAARIDLHTASNRVLDELPAAPNRKQIENNRAGLAAWARRHLAAASVYAAVNTLLAVQKRHKVRQTDQQRTAKYQEGVARLLKTHQKMIGDFTEVNRHERALAKNRGWLGGVYVGGGTFGYVQRFIQSEKLSAD